VGVGIRQGVGRLRARYPRSFVAVAIGCAAVVLGSGALFAGAAAGNGAAVAENDLAAVSSTGAALSPTPTEAPRPMPSSVLPATVIRTCSIADAAASARLGTFSGSVRNAATGELLYDHSGGVFSRTASVMKVLTAAAALAVLGPDYQAKTTVVAGTAPGEIVLVGGGDITLASTGSNIYRDAASLPDLAAQVAASVGSTSITSIVLDSSAFTGDPWQPSWLRKEQVDGYSSEVTALQIDGDRADPGANVSPRSTDPVGRAGAAFVDALSAAGAAVGGATVSLGTAPAGTPVVLGTVSSAPVSTMIPDALLRSDNTEAEMLARLTAKALGAGSSFGSLATGIPEALASYGLDTTGLVIVDGSGLSDDNGVSPNFLTQLFAKINARDGTLGVIADGLPVAGKTGTLAGRFTGSNADAAGQVIAKTGWIDTGYTLAGIIHAADGSTLTFAFFALDDVADSARSALDTVTAAAFRCGNNLSNS
jgi:D-alanyl-D-alanine carboxypeptidase/D-alanyl-D-alanine-endopeptidase (penicillin-binding protein 4)